MEIYLDNSATTKVCRESAEAMMTMLTENYGNPSSLHSKGVQASKALENGVLNDVVSEIRESVNPDYVHVIENISLIATVGHGMAMRSGTAATLFNALAKENINIRMIDQGSSELNIIIGVANADYEKCIRAIYKAFTEQK